MKGILFLCMALGVCACKNKGIDGLQSDTIKLSTEKLTVEAGGGTRAVTTEGKQWFIDRYVYVDGQFYNGKSENAPVTIESEVSNDLDVIKITGKWFTVTKETSQKIVFDVKPNETGKARVLSVPLWDRDYYTGITLTQAAE
jgi:hypothetical protein